MKKIRVWMAVILAAVFCISAAAGSGEAELTYGVVLETNTGYKADLYPYVVHGETADWYLAKADIEALGLEAMCEGLAQTMENAKAWPRRWKTWKPIWPTPGRYWRIT